MKDSRKTDFYSFDCVEEGKGNSNLSEYIFISDPYYRMNNPGLCQVYQEAPLIHTIAVLVTITSSLGLQNLSLKKLRFFRIGRSLAISTNKVC